MLQQIRPPIVQRAGDFHLMVARGLIDGHVGKDIFGESDNVDNGVLTDLWDRANATDTQAIWTAPTAARIHQIVSSSTSDDGSPVGVGARTLLVEGLTSWDLKETSEIITMNGTTNVPTVNSYVIIHHMEVLTKGATNINVGIITATADTDSTVTAQMAVGKGHTQMAIYGVPSVQTAFITKVSGSLGNVGSGKQVEFDLVINNTPKEELTNFLLDYHASVAGGGSSNLEHNHVVPDKHPGPFILKLQGTGDSNNQELSGSFHFILIDNDV
jgi:hypothetical protein